jgi:hypothetical protein
VCFCTSKATDDASSTRDASSSTVVVDLFMDAQPTSEHERPHAHPKPSQKAKGAGRARQGGRRTSRAMHEHEESDGLVLPMKPRTTWRSTPMRSVWREGGQSREGAATKQVPDSEPGHACHRRRSANVYNARHDRDKSRMRESRKSGSVRGVRRESHLYSPRMIRLDDIGVLLDIRQ